MAVSVNSHKNDSATQKGGTLYEFIMHLKKQGKLLMLVGTALLGIILIILGSNAKNTNNQQKNAVLPDDKSKYDIISYSELLEKKIKKLCQDVDGVGNVTVAVTLEKGFEYVYAQNSAVVSDKENRSDEYKYLVIKDGNKESVVYITGKAPKIKGVAIVCRGGGNIEVQYKLTNLISAGFGVSKNNICVMEAK